MSFEGKDPSRDVEAQKPDDAGERASERLDEHPHRRGIASLLNVRGGEVYNPHPEKNPKWYQNLLDAGIEENGIKPVPLSKRTNTQYSNLFTVFFTCLLCLLP